MRLKGLGSVSPGRIGAKRCSFVCDAAKKMNVRWATISRLQKHLCKRTWIWACNAFSLCFESVSAQMLSLFMPDSVGQGDFPRTGASMMEGGREVWRRVLALSPGKSLHFINTGLFISKKTELSLIAISNIVLLPCHLLRLLEHKGDRRYWLDRG